MSVVNNDTQVLKITWAENGLIRQGKIWRGN